VESQNGILYLHQRNNIHILDLEKTKNKLTEALEFAKETASMGGTILFVGTKRQAKEEVRKAAESCGMPYVVTRWLGGTFTNFRTIQRTIKKMERYEKMIADGEISKYTKKEQLMIAREVEKMKTFFSGIKEMKKLPEAIFVLDTKYDHIPVEEARQSKVKVIGIVDTNSDPTKSITSFHPTMMQSKSSNLWPIVWLKLSTKDETALLS
jgi:small subunit ribosomal protein S2